jgi:hypothetical protein
MVVTIVSIGLLTVVLLVDSEVHEGFDSLLAKGCLGLKFVERVIEYLSIVGKELSHFA